MTSNPGPDFRTYSARVECHLHQIRRPCCAWSVASLRLHESTLILDHSYVAAADVRSSQFITQIQRHIQRLLGLPAKQKTGRHVSMAMAHILFTIVAFLSLSGTLVNATPGPAAAPTPGPTPGSFLSVNYYDGLCASNGTAQFQNITDSVVAPKIAADPGLAPALMRMAFHDCFVEGCDASVLLNSTQGNEAEKDAIPNLTLRGFEVVDAVKAELELVCPGVFSCADILQEVALAAQRHVVQQSPKGTWFLKYGRRDGRVSLGTEVLTNIPSPALNYTQLVANFAAQGLKPFDLVTLSGAHTFGVAHCITFSQRLYNFNGNGTGTDPALDPAFAASLKAQCPPGSPFNIVKMDAVTPDTFDNQYHKNIGAGKVVFTSDNALKSDPLGIAANNASNGVFVGVNFAASFTKMTEIQVKLFPEGEIRLNCALRN